MKLEIINATIALTPRQQKELRPLFDALYKLRDGDETASICGQAWETGHAYFRVFNVAQTKTVHSAIMRATAPERRKEPKPGPKKAGKR